MPPDQPSPTEKTNFLKRADVDVGGRASLAPVPARVQDGRRTQVVVRPELVVGVAVVITGSRRASVLEGGSVPVLVDGVVEFAKVKLAVVEVLLRESLPVVVTVASQGQRLSFLLLSGQLITYPWKVSLTSDQLIDGWFPSTAQLA